MRCVCWHVFSHARYNCMLLQHKLNVKLLLVTLVMHLWVVASWHSIYGFLCNITAVSVLDVQMNRVIQGYQFITAVYLSPLARNSPIKSAFKRQIRLPGCKFLFLTPMRCKVIFRLIFAWWFQYDWVFFSLNSNSHACLSVSSFMYAYIFRNRSFRHCMTSQSGFTSTVYFGLDLFLSSSYKVISH